MMKWKFISMLILIVLSHLTFIFSEDAVKLQLRNYATQKGIYIGCAVMPQHLDEPTFVNILTNNFNYLTPENNMKWELIHPKKDSYDFSGADKIVEFGLKNGMRIRGHTLVWHYQNPKWLLDSKLTREEAMEVLKNHIMTVVGRYKGKVKDWDVVNEPMGENGVLRWNIWYQNIGEDYIELALNWAKEADPDAKLFLNDYGIEPVNAKSDGFYRLVKKLKSKGVPLDGVGFQFHLDGKFYPDFASIAQNIKRFKDLGLEVHFTEVDVRLYGKPSQREIEQHERIFSELMKLALAYDCKAFITWGLSDKYSWIPSFFSGYGYGLMFDENYKPKSAALAVRDVLKGEKPKSSIFEIQTTSQERPLPAFRGKRVDNVPVIDGKFNEEEWKDAYVYPFVFNQLNTKDFVPPASYDDIYGNWRIVYKGSKIYGVVLRKDNLTVVNHKDPWDNDNFELFYNIDGKWKQIRTIVGKDWQKDHNVNGKAIWNSDGGILEFEVDVGVDLTGKTIGFNVALSDNDTPDNSLRKCQLYPIVGNNTGWQGKGFGEMTFEDENGNFIDKALIGDVMPFLAPPSKIPPVLDGVIEKDEWKNSVRYPLAYNRFSKDQSINNGGAFRFLTVENYIYGAVEILDNKISIENLEFLFSLGGETIVLYSPPGSDFDKKQSKIEAKAVWSKDKKDIEFMVKIRDKSISNEKARFSLGIIAKNAKGENVSFYPFCGYNLIDETKAKGLGELMSKKGIETAIILCQ